MNRRQWMIRACGVLVSAGGAYAIGVEPCFLGLTSHVVECGLGGSRAIRLLHLTDLHASHFVSMRLIERAVDIGIAQKPDLICVTGDFITSKDGFDESEYVSVLQRLSAAGPTFAVLGNHDGNSWAKRHGGFADHSLVERILAKSQIKLLHNRSERLRFRGHSFRLVGVGDLWSEEIEEEAAFQHLDGSEPTILLAHNPDSKDVLKNYPWHVMLSGHTHGGQVIVPFEGPCFAPVRDRRFVAGLKPWGARQIFVNRGVGNIGGVRFGCRPEVSLLTLA